MVLAFNRTAVLIRIFSENALGYVNFWCLPQDVQSFTKIYNRNFALSSAEAPAGYPIKIK